MNDATRSVLWVYVVLLLLMLLLVSLLPLLLADTTVHCSLLIGYEIFCVHVSDIGAK